MTENDVARFWKFVDRSGGSNACWPWTGCRNSFGHGEFKLDGKSVMAYRVAYELGTGQHLLPGMVVRHKCNNPACCNPAHLTYGTHADNVRDRVEAGRSATGERNGRAKLTWAAVADIRRRHAGGTSQGQLAREYGVTRRTIRFIVRNEHWVVPPDRSTPHSSGCSIAQNAGLR